MDERSRRIEARLEVPMIFAAALAIPLLLLEHAATAGWLRDVAAILNWVVWLAFATEAVIMLAVVPSRAHWLRRHPLEVAVVLLTAPVLPAALQAFRALRLLRLLRLLLFARRVRGLLTPGGLSHAALLGFVTVCVGGAALRVVEPAQQLSLEESLWWALVTATTVGYGDIAPTTDTGRIIGGVVMLVGVGFVALLTAALARAFMTIEDDVDATRDPLLDSLDRLHLRLDRMEEDLRQLALDREGSAG